MLKRLLFGTTNLAKVDYVKTVIKTLPIEIFSLNDLNINISIEEDGKNPGENALIKSKSYYLESKMPTFSFDSGFIHRKIF